MVTLSNTLTSVLAGSAQFSDPVTKVIYDQFSKVLLRLWLLSSTVWGWGGNASLPSGVRAAGRGGQRGKVERNGEGDHHGDENREGTCKNVASPVELRCRSFYIRSKALEGPHSFLHLASAH